MKTIPDALRSSYLVKGMTADEIGLLSGIAAERDVEGDDIIVREFDNDSDLFLVLDGWVQIRSVNEEVLAEVGPGSILGEVSLIDDRPRSATLVSQGSCRLAVFPSESLRALMDSNPKLCATIYKNLGRLLCVRLRSANVQLDALLARQMP